jgi:hypothetical protein
MSIRLTCRSCRTAFVTGDDRQGQRLTCPKCGAEQQVPRRPAAAAPLAAEPEAAEASVFVPAAERPRRRRLHATLLLLFVVLPLLAVAGILAWPAIHAWLHPVPPDEIEVVATSYLEALSHDDRETMSRLSTIDEPPAIRSYRTVSHEKDRDERLKGSFRPIAELHGRIDEKFEYNPETGRYQTRNPLGLAAETLDALHGAKAEQAEIARKIESGSPDDLFDAAEQLGGSFGKLAEGILAPKNLVPTYEQLVLDAKPPLPEVEKELALDYGRNQARWDDLLKRPFATLRADGPFVLERAEVVATVIDRLASSGDPPTRLRLKLVRFRLETIDTRWRVVSARREGEPEPSATPTPTQAESTHPANASQTQPTSR